MKGIIIIIFLLLIVGAIASLFVYPIVSLAFVLLCFLSFCFVRFNKSQKVVQSKRGSSFTVEQKNRIIQADPSIKSIEKKQYLFCKRCGAYSRVWSLTGKNYKYFWFRINIMSNFSLYYTIAHKDRFPVLECTKCGERKDAYLDCINLGVPYDLFCYLETEINHQNQEVAYYLSDGKRVEITDEARRLSQPS